MIVDAHHHIWELARTPWLNGPTVPRIFGEYNAIRRDYSIEEYSDDAREVGVTASIYVQINVAPGDEVDEVARATEAGRQRDLIQGVVSFVDLSRADTGEVLDRQIASGPVCGVRQQLHWHDDPAFRFASAPDAMLRPAFVRGLRQVEARGLAFDLQVFPSQYEDALELIDQFRHLTFVLLHAGMPLDRSAAGIASWVAGLQDIARRDNVVVKLSGLGTFVRRCTVDDWQPVVERTVEVFGPDRCMFGSNFPIEKLWTDYRTLMDVFRTCIAHLSQSEQADILGQVALRTYGLAINQH